MAINLQSRGLLSIGKRFLAPISYRKPSLSSSSSSSSSSSLFLRRTVQGSAYDKNPDEPVHHASFIPDDVISPKSDKYWAPHPKTGVFSPASENPAGGKRDFQTDRAGSVLEEKTFFRPLEDLEKPVL